MGELFAAIIYLTIIYFVGKAILEFLGDVFSAIGDFIVFIFNLALLGLGIFVTLYVLTKIYKIWKEKQNYNYYKKDNYSNFNYENYYKNSNYSNYNYQKNHNQESKNQEKSSNQKNDSKSSNDKKSDSSENKKNDFQQKRETQRDKALKFFDLGENATREEIKKRYRELSKKYHPDINKDCSKCERMMKKLNRYKEILLK